MSTVSSIERLLRIAGWCIFVSSILVASWVVGLTLIYLVGQALGI